MAKAAAPAAIPDTVRARRQWWQWRCGEPRRRSSQQPRRRPQRRPGAHRPRRPTTALTPRLDAMNNRMRETAPATPPVFPRATAGGDGEVMAAPILANGSPRRHRRRRTTRTTSSRTSTSRPTPPRSPTVAASTGRCTTSSGARCRWPVRFASSVIPIAWSSCRNPACPADR